MTLFFIGLGLGSKKDVTVKGLEAIKSCDYLYLEHYTSIIPGCDVKELEDYYEKPIIIAGRELVEQQAEEMLDKAKDFNVGFLVVGDVFGATTHTDLFLRAKEKNLEVEVINNASIMNAIANVGLELYKFGKTTSMVFFEENWKPKNVFDTLEQNATIGAHTLVLLDIKVAEASPENMRKGIDIKLPPRFMSVNQGLQQLLDLEDMEKKQLLSEETKVIGIARMGAKNQVIKHGTIKELLKFDFGDPVHCLIVPGKLHFIEEEALKIWE